MAPRSQPAISLASWVLTVRDLANERRERDTQVYLRERALRRRAAEELLDARDPKTKTKSVPAARRYRFPRETWLRPKREFEQETREQEEER